MIVKAISLNIYLTKLPKTSRLSSI